MIRRSSVVAAAAAVVALWCAPVAGQGRTPDGQPDVQGFWANQTHRLATYNIEGAADAVHVLLSGNPTDETSLIVDPHTRCFLSGIPRMFYQGAFQILQPPGYVVVLQEFNHGTRIIPLDQRPHVGNDITLWMGDSRGHWEGNTLVVDVTNKNDKTWFDIVGDFHSDQVHIRERFTIVSAERIDYQATFEDPKVYTRPFTIALTFGRTVKGDEAKRYELFEEACHEGDHDTQEMVRRLTP